jgi:hypothetical protein
MASACWPFSAFTKSVLMLGQKCYLASSMCGLGDHLICSLGAGLSPPPADPTGIRFGAPTCLTRSMSRLSSSLASSASFPTTPPSPAWCGRCCWSSSSIGSWSATACSSLTAWPPTHSLTAASPCKPSAPDECSTQMQGNRGCSASIECSDFNRCAWDGR